MSDANTLARYTRNMTDAATGALTFPDDSRPDLPIGQVGYVTPEEMQLAAAHGVVLEEITEQDAQDLGLEVPKRDLPLSDMNNKDLRAIADAEGADITGKKTNADIVTAIEENRSAQPEGSASLPATATTAADTAGTTTGATAS